MKRRYSPKKRSSPKKSPRQTPKSGRAKLVKKIKDNLPKVLDIIGLVAVRAQFVDELNKIANSINSLTPEDKHELTLLFEAIAEKNEIDKEKVRRQAKALVEGGILKTLANGSIADLKEIAAEWEPNNDLLIDESAKRLQQLYRDDLLSEDFADFAIDSLNRSSHVKGVPEVIEKIEEIYY